MATSFQQQFEEAMRALESGGANNIVRPPVPTLPQFQAPAPIDFSGLQQHFDVGFTPYDNSGANKTLTSNVNYIQNNDSNNDSWWDNFKQGLANVLQSKSAQTVFNTLDVPRNALFTQLNNWFDGKAGLGDIPGVGIVQGAINSYGDNPQDKVYFGDLAGSVADRFGATSAADSFRDKAHDGKIDGGDVLDILLDPTTYLTFGAGNTVKATGQATKALLKQGVDLSTAEGKALLDDAVKQATAKSNNQLVGLNIPFGPEFTLANKFGPLRTESQLIGDVPASDLAQRLTSLGVQPDVALKGVGDMFGKDLTSTGLKGLNTQEFDHLMEQLNGELGQNISQIVRNGLSITPDAFNSTSKLSFKQPNLADIAEKIKPQVDQAVTPPLENPKLLAKYLADNLPKIGIPVSKADLASMSYTDMAEWAKMVQDGIVPQTASKVAGNMGIDLQRILDGKAPTLKQTAERAHMARVAGVNTRDLPKNIKSPSSLPSSSSAISAFGEKTAEALKQAGSGYKYYSGLDGMSELGKTVKGSKLFEDLAKVFGSRRHVPVTTKLADHRVERGVGAVLNSRNAGFAEAVNQIKQLEKTVKESPDIKALSKSELEMLPYLMESGITKTSTPEELAEAFPKSMQDQLPSAERLDVMHRAVDALNTFKTSMTDLEKQMGVTYNTRENYFPHIMNIPKGAGDDAIYNVLERINPQLATKLKNSPAGFRKDRKMFETMAHLKDFLKTQENILADSTASAEAKASAQQAIDMFGQAAFNPVEAFGKRAIRGAREIARVETVSKLKEMGLAKPNNGKIPNGWVNVRETIPELKDMIVPEPVYKQITYADNILQNDESINKIFETVERVYNVWRRNVTVVRGGFHVRQMIGNVFQNSMAGVTPKYYREALKVLAKPDKYQDIIHDAIKHGIVNTGSTSADMLTSLEKELGNTTAVGDSPVRRLANAANPFGEQFAPGKVGKKLGEWEDNVARLAHYMWAKGNGASAEAASNSVRKYLFNYSEINKFGRVARGFIPFYQWMRNNIPFQIVNAVKNPGKYQAISEGLNAMQNEPDVEQVLDDMNVTNEQDRTAIKQIIEENGGVLPDYIREKYVNVGGDNYFNVSLPSSDLNMLKNPGGELINAVSPFIKLPFELLMNKKTLNGSPIDKYAAETPSMLEGAKYTLEQLGGGPAQLLTGLLQADLDKVLKSTGMVPTNVDLSKEVQNLIWDKRKQIEADRKKAKQSQ